MILAPQKYPVFIQMAPGTFSTATLFTLPHSTSRSGQIIEPQLNRGSIHSPDQRLFVPIYFKKSTRYHVSLCEGVSSPRRTHRRRESPMHNSPTWNLKLGTWSSSNRNRLVPLLFLKSPQINNSNLALIFLPPRPSVRFASASHDFLTILHYHDPFFRPSTPSTFNTSNHQTIL
jgi:hypothetical protein